MSDPTPTRWLRGNLTRLATLVGATTVGAFDRTQWRVGADGSDWLVLEGWLDAARSRHPVRGLTLYVDGQHVLEIAVNDMGERWRAGDGGAVPWRVEVSASGIGAHAWLEVLARTARESLSLGVQVVPRRSPDAIGLLDSPPRGRVDAPKPDEVVEAQACQVAGWTNLDGSAADYVEVFVGDAAPQRLRRGLPRLDTYPSPTRHSCGFDSVVTLPEQPVGSKVLIRVRAVGVRGSVWHSDPVSVTIGARHAQTGLPKPIALPPVPARLPRRVPARDARPARVAVFTHSLRLGGGQLYLQQLLLSLAAAQEAELLVVSPEDGTLRSELEDAGIAVHITRGYPVDPVFYDGELVEMRSLIERWGADLVLANTLGTFPAIDAAIQAGLPTVWAIHESFELPVFAFLNWGPHGLDGSVAPRIRSALLHCQAVVFETRSTLELYAETVPEMNARLIPYGVSEAEIAAYIAATSRDELTAAAGMNPGELIFVCVGVFEARKAMIALVAAFAEATRHRTGVRLIMVGAHHSPYSDAVCDMIDTLGLGDTVSAVAISADVYPWYRVADFIVSASDVESLPRSLLQAMTFGLPVIAADAFGTSELVADGKNGFLFEPNSHTALVAAIVRALAVSPDDRAEMGRQSQRRVAALGGQHYDRDYAALIAELIGAGRERERND